MSHNKSLDIHQGTGLLGSIRPARRFGGDWLRCLGLSDIPEEADAGDRTLGLKDTTAGDRI